MADFPNCPFRLPLATDHQEGKEDAVCDLVRRITGAAAERCRVNLSACKACVTHSPFASPDTNPVISTLVYQATDPAENSSHSQQSVLWRWAKSAIEVESAVPFAPVSYACDIVVLGEVDEPYAPQAIDSVCDQTGVFVVGHMLGRPDIGSHTKLINWRHHRAEADETLLESLIRLLPHLETAFVAIQHTHTISNANRLHAALDALNQKGDEFYLSANKQGDSVDPIAESNGGDSPQNNRWHTLVMRRAALIDTLTQCDDKLNSFAQFLHHANQQQRKFFHDDEVTVQCLPGGSVTELNTAARPATNRQATTSTFRASPPKTYRCEVVLPFHDELDYVREAFDSLVAQRHVELVIHLIDDHSLQDTSDFFSSLAGLANVRLYRNTTNIGPFASFNNVMRFVQSPFVAVQDADDISLPDRLARSCELLDQSGADLMGAATQLIGDQQIIPQVAHDQSKLGDDVHWIRRSRYPRRRTARYFLENPTLVMRADWFRRIGGYADFGELKRNRTGIDTELQVRAYYSFSHIAVTNRILLQYRCHSSSATNAEDTGLGSRANRESHQELERRMIQYVSGMFDPRPYGALNLHADITRPLGE